MSDAVTKDPKFSTAAEIAAENERRKASIEKFQKLPADQIRPFLRCTLDAAVGRPHTQPAGELLHVNKNWLIRPADREEHDKLMSSVIAVSSGGGMGMGMGPPILTGPSLDMIEDAVKKMDAIYRRGSDHLRGVVDRAADWACVPPEMLAAILQNENSPRATDFQRGNQAIERVFQSWIGIGSTGFGNVKPETRREAAEVFRTYYRTDILRPGVKDARQNDNVETDIYHAAAALRDGLNKAWSGGERSLNKDLSGRYVYYPYFGGTVSQDVATRAMGHFNGMGDKAKGYGETGMKQIQKERLRFLAPR